MLKRKKMLVYPLFFLVFLGAMWLIFAPSDSDEPLREGFNVDVPMPEDKGLLSDKKTAYEQSAFEKKQKEKMNTLQDLAVSLEQEEPAADEVFLTEEDTDNGSPSIRSSANAYQDINRQLDSFYETRPAEDDQKTLELEWRIQELERQAEEERKARENSEEQLRLMEKSYEMAARYMPGGGETKQVAVSSSTGKTPVCPVTQVTERVVSLLAAPLSDEEFARQYGKPRNMGFHTVGTVRSRTERNGIRACVYRTVTVSGSDGQEVGLRLLEPVQAGELYIPANTILTGTAKISGERMEITVSSVAFQGTILPVELDAYDTRGMKGIEVRGSQELTAVKEMAANMGSAMGSSINISTNAGAQLAADLGKGVIQGASQYLSTKFRTAKATLKADYELLLVSRQ
jgi:conjugative transposon TraM protein